MSAGREFDCPDEAATQALGAALARALPRAPVDRALRVYLRGELGAGKTTLVRALLQTLGVGGAIRSPTYAVLECHAAGDWVGVHVDLYRLARAQDLVELGLADFDRPRHLWLIEWPERAGAALPAADLDIELTVGEGTRLARHRARVRTGSEVGDAWLSALVAPR